MNRNVFDLHRNFKPEAIHYTLKETLITLDGSTRQNFPTPMSGEEIYKPKFVICK